MNEETRKKISESMMGKQHTEETKQKISETLKKENKMNRMLEKIFTTRANNTNLNEVSAKTDNEFYKNFVEFIRNNSRVLNKAQIIEGTIMSGYAFDIEDTANYTALLGNNDLQNPVDISKRATIFPKAFGLEVLTSKYNFDFDNLDDKNKEQILKNLLYRPFLRAIEKCVIGGAYFDKPIFSTTNAITGTNDFNGLLKLVRELKDKQDNNIIMGNSAVINKIIDTVTNEAYLNEYLLNGTIEGIPIVGTVEAPAQQNGNILVGIDPNNIILLLTPDLQVKKVSVMGTNSYFQLYSFVNGGDIFDKSVGLKI